MGDFTLPFQKQRTVARLNQLPFMLLLLLQRQLVLLGFLPTLLLLLPQRQLTLLLGLVILSLGIDAGNHRERCHDQMLMALTTSYHM